MALDSGMNNLLHSDTDDISLAYSTLVQHYGDVQPGSVYQNIIDVNQDEFVEVLLEHLINEDLGHREDHLSPYGSKWGCMHCVDPAW